MEAAYGQQITGEGPTYQERQKGRVQFKDCREDIAAGYLEGHKMTQHGRAVEVRRSWKILDTGEETQTYRMSFPYKGGPRS